MTMTIGNLLTHSPGCNFPIIDEVTAFTSKARRRRRRTCTGCILSLGRRRLVSFAEVVAFFSSDHPTFLYPSCSLLPLILFLFFFSSLSLLFPRRDASRFCRDRRGTLFIFLRRQTRRRGGVNFIQPLNYCKSAHVCGLSFRNHLSAFQSLTTFV